MATGPQIDNSSLFASGTHSFTVASHPRTALIVWGEGTISGSTPVAPAITYNGVSVTWPNTPAYNAGGNFASWWVGYIINPTVGTFNVISPARCNVSVFYDVDLSNPLPTANSASGTTTSPVNTPIATQFADSLVLKSLVASNLLGYTDSGTPIFNDSSGEIRGDYQNTTTAGTYTASTSFTGGGSNSVAQQAVELKWGGTFSLTALSGTFALTGNNAIISWIGIIRPITALAGTFALVGHNATFAYIPNPWGNQSKSNSTWTNQPKS